ncbi:Glycerophosphoryl diester phosphodiesterase family protein [Spironucleus salmonicida]|uniref:Glycerophosphoryl diester phosphodiesterase family protein n=1 Tax=Spironucleus salmonicida TaxID=348837 RepID=V6LW01_9EUKA|nr:Glycerophosphoryl diester phosphodiesterase family protein [Spironucleus salmonicida]|eukprot:EST48740.1 Glycerophosphoryl diester phosphodiesterase family protein [Spironucleus salmonicida]
MYKGSSPYWVAGVLCYLDIITIVFNHQQIDCDFRFKFQLSFPSICAFAGCVLIFFLALLIAFQVIFKRQTIRIALQWTMVALMAVVTIFLQCLAQGYNIYPILTITLLLAPVATLAYYITKFRTSSATKCLGRIAWFAICASAFFLYGNSIFYDTFSFTARTSSGLFIAHRSGPQNGPEGTAYTIQKTCKASTPFAVELDVRLTKDKELILAHDKEISHYSGDARFKGKLMADEDLSTLMRINVGKLWIRIDPYRQYTKHVDEAVTELTLNSAQQGIDAIRAHCKMENETASLVMLDVKDQNNAKEVIHAIKALVAANPDVNFTIRVDAKNNLQEAKRAFGGDERVTIHAAGLLFQTADFVSTITFAAPLYAKYQRSMHVVSWTIQTSAAARLLAGTGSIVTSDFAMGQKYTIFGGGYLLVTLIAAGLFMVILVAHRSITGWINEKTGRKCENSVLV